MAILYFNTKMNTKIIGTEAIYYNNSCAMIQATEFRDNAKEQPWISVKIITVSGGDHETMLTFQVNPKDADNLQKMGELLLLAAKVLKV